jgi:hypothetical protein
MEDCKVKKDHGAQPIGLADAYDTLSQEAFAIWMRLHLFTDEQLNSGRLKIASMTGYSESRVNNILRELRLAGYLTFHPSEKPGNTTKIKFAKVCKISGHNRFVKLSNFLFTGHESVPNVQSNYNLPEPNSQKGEGGSPNQPMECFEATQEFNVLSAHHGQSIPLISPYGLPIINAKSNLLEYNSQKVGTEPLNQSMDFCDPQNQECLERNEGNAGSKVFDEKLSKSITANSRCENESCIPKFFSALKYGDNQDDCQEYDLLQIDENGENSGNQERPRRIKFYTTEGGLSHGRVKANESDTIVSFKEKKNEGLNLSLFSLKSRAKRDSTLPKPQHPDVGKPIDWDRLDQWGKPQITFNPSTQEREQMVALLSGDSRRLTPAERKLKRDMEKKLESEFTRMYERYRRMVLRENGSAKTMYEVMEGERKYALKAAVACIVKGVTPRQVLEYWHNHIGDFADSKMPVPPITFLSQPANIDTVQISTMPGQSNKPKRARKRGRLPSVHTMSDTSLLHPKLRKALMSQGFDLMEMNDSYLTTIQAYAIDIVSGAVDVRLIPSKIRGMVKWAAENFYRDVDVEDYI